MDTVFCFQVRSCRLFEEALECNILCGSLLFGFVLRWADYVLHTSFKLIIVLHQPYTASKLHKCNAMYDWALYRIFQTNTVSRTQALNWHWWCMHLFTYLCVYYTLLLLYRIHLVSFSNTYLNAHQLPTIKSQAKITSSQLTILTLII